MRFTTIYLCIFALLASANNAYAQEVLDTLQIHVTADTVYYTDIPEDTIEAAEPFTTLQEYESDTIYQEEIHSEEQLDVTAQTTTPPPSQEPKREEIKAYTETNSASEAQSTNTSSQNDTEQTIIKYLFIGFLVWIVFKIVSSINRSRCPKCRKYFVMSVTKKQQVDKTYCGTRKNSAGKKERVYEYKYRIIRTCSRCGHTKTSYKTEKEGKTA